MALTELIGLIPLLFGGLLVAQLPPSTSAVLASPVRAISALSAWRINADGVLELRTTPNVNLTASFDAGGGNQGPRLWIDFPGTPTRPRNIAGAAPHQALLSLDQILCNERRGRSHPYQIRLLPATHLFSPAFLIYLKGLLINDSSLLVNLDYTAPSVSANQAA